MKSIFIVITFSLFLVETCNRNSNNTNKNEVDNGVFNIVYNPKLNNIKIDNRNQIEGEAKRVIVLDSNLSIRRIYWCHDSDLYFYMQEFDSDFPERLSHKYFFDAVDTSLIKLPRWKIREVSDSLVQISFDFQCYPPTLISTFCYPDHLGYTTYDKQGKIVIKFKKVDEVNIAFACRTREEKLVKIVSLKLGLEGKGTLLGKAEFPFNIHGFL